MRRFCAHRAQTGSTGTPACAGRLIHVGSGVIVLKRFLLACVFACLAGAGVAALQGHTGLSLESALDQLDTQAHGFHSLAADVERTKVTVVVNDRSTETGSILVHGDHMRMEIKAPDARTILRTGDSFFIFNPKLNRVEEYNLGKYKAFADQYLLLGFGTPGHELKKGYLVTLRGEPTLDGKKTCELELTPKSEAMRNQISKIQLWFDEARGCRCSSSFSRLAQTITS